MILYRIRSPKQLCNNIINKQYLTQQNARYMMEGPSKIWKSSTCVTFLFSVVFRAVGNVQYYLYVGQVLKITPYVQSTLMPS